MKISRILRRQISIMSMVLVSAAILLSTTGCTVRVKADDLMHNVKPNSVVGKTQDEPFIKAAAGFSVNLFGRSLDEDDNALVSPLSVLLALSMTANGAKGETLTQMQDVLGGISINDLNKYLYAYVKALPNEKKAALHIANSIWFRNDSSLQVNPDFLQANADYFQADAFRSPFNNQTAKDINNWVKQHTNGMIDEIVDEIRSDNMMFLINALAFEAEWAAIYEKKDVREGVFTEADGEKETVKFMHSSEGQYLNDGKATGFIKPYANNTYSFVALLPYENVGIDQYIKSLTGEGFVKTLQDATNSSVIAAMPKFSYDYSIEMKKVLQDMGMAKAFSDEEADFSGIGQCSAGNLFINSVLHKTYIAVDERGTKAGAVTKVEINCSSAGPGNTKTVILDRPFVYAIVDNATKLPLFMGTVREIED